MTIKMYVLVGPALNFNLQYAHLLLHSSIWKRFLWTLL